MIKMLTWTAIVALPGGVLLLPVVIARRMLRRRHRLEADAVVQSDAVVQADADAPPAHTVEA